VFIFNEQKSGLWSLLRFENLCILNQSAFDKFSFKLRYWHSKMALHCQSIDWALIQLCIVKFIYINGQQVRQWWTALRSNGVGHGQSNSTCSWQARAPDLHW